MSIKKRITIPHDKLAKIADDFAKKSLSPATKRAYESDWSIFHSWCLLRELDALPSSPETICLYLAELAEQNLNVSTIIRKLTSINAIHLAANFKSPKNDAVKRVMKGIKNTLGKPSEHARSLSWDELCAMLSLTDNLMIGLRDAALLALGWSSALRRSELVGLNISDLEITENGILLKICRSKTDQEGTGKILAIPRAADKTICPVERVTKWMERRNIYTPDDPLFTSIGAEGKTAWYWITKKRLPDRMVSIIVKKYGGLAGLPINRLSAHSLRRGLATNAARRNVPERVIARHTRHNSLSVLRTYIDEGTIWNDNPLTSIYTPRPSSSPVTGLG